MAGQSIAIPIGQEKHHQSSKRGFPTKREAQMWERELLLKKEAKLDMTFESFYEIYVEDMQNRIRDNTWGTKTNIARTKILPYSESVK